MRYSQDTFEIRKRSFISPFSICMTVPLIIRVKYSCFFLILFHMVHICSNNKNGLCHSKISNATQITAGHDGLTYVTFIKFIKKTRVEKM